MDERSKGTFWDRKYRRLSRAEREPRSCETFGHAASAEMSDRAMGAIEMKFGEMEWFEELMKVFA